MRYLFIALLFIACKKESFTKTYDVQFVVTSQTGLPYLTCRIGSDKVGNYTINKAKSGDRLSASYSRCCRDYFDAVIYVDGVVVASTTNDKYLNLEYKIP